VFRLNGGSGDPFGDPDGFGPPEEPEKLKIHWENLTSLRYWFGSLFSGIGIVIAVTILAALVGWTLPDWLIQALFFGFIGLALFGGLVGRRYWCPHCRGMVSQGATVCRHCGREFEI